LQTLTPSKLIFKLIVKPSHEKSAVVQQPASDVGGNGGGGGYSFLNGGGGGSYGYQTFAQAASGGFGGGGGGGVGGNGIGNTGGGSRIGGGGGGGYSGGGGYMGYGDFGGGGGSIIDSSAVIIGKEISGTNSGNGGIVIVQISGQFSQTISFGALASKLLGDAPFTLSATASSGLSVSYTSSNLGVATVSGNTVTITGIGSTTITAIQVGNGTYLPAANVSQTLTVSLTTVHFTANPTFGGVPFTVQFSSTNIDSGGHAISQWNWNFGDGSTSTAQNPSHIYTTVASFSPSLIATIPYGYTVVASGPSITGLPLLVNGGFETGDFSGWSEGGNFTSCSVVTGSLYAHSGTYGGEFGPAGPSLAYLSQFLPTATNGVYTLSFWLDSPDGLTPNEFSVAWDGTTLMDKKSFGAVGWTNIQFTVTASGTNTLLQFGFRDDNSFLGLDDVSVTPPAAPIIASIHLSGTNLVLNGSNGLSGTPYYTLMSTNLILWIPIATNFFNVNGNYTITVTNAVNPTASQRFYRIELP
jgi:PKD repeat protein